MEIINRYVYAVTKNLPLNQRTDIEKELKTLIEDMMEEFEEYESIEVKAQKAILKLGDPDILASKYKDNNRYLIGPENFDNYLLVLKIVSFAVFIGISIATVVGVVFTLEDNNIALIIGNYFANLLSALLQGFAWVTGIFLIFQYTGVKIKKYKNKTSWSLADLPQIPLKKGKISKLESIIGIMFSTIFIIVLFFAPKIFAVYMTNEELGTIVIPIFNLKVFNSYKVLFLAIFITSVFKETLKLKYGKWSLNLSVTIVILNILSLILTIIIFSNMAIFNNELPNKLLEYYNIDVDFPHVWSMFTRWFISIFIFAYIIESITVMYKGLKYK